MARFYAVKQGRIPGVYSNWSDCEAQVKGYRGALYKSFNNEEDAKKFQKMLDLLDDDDDVQEVYHNAEFPEGWDE